MHNAVPCRRTNSKVFMAEPPKGPQGKYRRGRGQGGGADVRVALERRLRKKTFKRPRRVTATRGGPSKFYVPKTFLKIFKAILATLERII